MPMVVHPKIARYIIPEAEQSDRLKQYCEAQLEESVEDRAAAEIYKAQLKSTLTSYKLLCDMVPVEEARMVLPNASAVNIIWTVNARSLANFIAQRECLRNVGEMIHIASRLHQFLKTSWPAFGKAIGPECMFTKCNQGKMTCGEPYKRMNDD